MLAQANQHEEAIKHLRSTVSASPNDNNARFLLAQELANASRHDEAEREFSSVVQSDPDNESALIGLVKIRLGQKQYSQALMALEKGHAQFPQKQLTAATLAYMLAASPRIDLRNGKRALELARAVYDATGTVNHGMLLAMAMAELGRCDEAAAWLRELTAKALAEGKRDFLETLKAELSRYEKARPCRPTGDPTITGQGSIP